MVKGQVIGTEALRIVAPGFFVNHLLTELEPSIGIAPLLSRRPGLIPMRRGGRVDRAGDKVSARWRMTGLLRSVRHDITGLSVPQGLVLRQMPIPYIWSAASQLGQTLQKTIAREFPQTNSYSGTTNVLIL